MSHMSNLYLTISERLHQGQSVSKIVRELNAPQYLVEQILFELNDV